MTEEDGRDMEDEEVENVTYKISLTITLPAAGTLFHCEHVCCTVVFRVLILRVQNESNTHRTKHFSYLIYYNFHAASSNEKVGEGDDVGYDDSNDNDKCDGDDVDYKRLWW